MVGMREEHLTLAAAVTDGLSSGFQFRMNLILLLRCGRIGKTPRKTSERWWWWLVLTGKLILYAIFNCMHIRFTLYFCMINPLHRIIAEWNIRNAIMERDVEDDFRVEEEEGR